VPRSSISLAHRAQVRPILHERSPWKRSKHAGVHFSTLADIIGSLAKDERDGQVRERIRYLGRASLLAIDGIAYLPITPGAAICSCSSSMRLAKRAL
jgi:hypothetical protein